LEAVDMVLPRGKEIAIVGGTGSGKSSIAHVLIKLFQNYEGNVSLDGVPLNRFDTRSIREGFTLLSQDIFLFQGTFRDNVDLEGRLSDVRVREICRAAQLTGILAKLPDGLDTLVGSEGVDFSGGERQRIAVARCLARDADIIIMDEATSALDSITEERLIRELKVHLSGKTIISITHKAKIAQWADLIFVMQDGRVVESGSHEDLLGLKGHYYRLFQSPEHGD
jgi:ABC-type multidrug transport system fused ATPase/permease subunit